MGVTIGRPQSDTFWSNEDDCREAMKREITARIQGCYSNMNEDERKIAFNAKLDDSYAMAAREFDAQQAYLLSVKPLTLRARIRKFFTRGSRASST